MNILQICGGGVRSGIETYVLNLAKSFRRTPFNIIISPLRYGLFTEELIEEGFEPRQVRKPFRGDPRVFFTLASIIQKEKIDIVHTHGENGNFYGRIVARLLHKKVVSTVHSHLREALLDMSEIAWVRELVYRQDLFFSFLNDRIVAPSHTVAKELIHNGLPEEKVSVIFSSVDVTASRKWTADFNAAARRQLRRRLGIAEDEFLVGTAGRVAPVKNHVLLVKAARIAYSQNKKLRFMIIGHGRIFNEIKAMIDASGLGACFVLPGWQKDVKPYLGILDTFVMTSITEGLNITVIEAMAMGIPVITTDRGSLPELVKDQISGFVVPLDPPDILADRILSLYNDPFLRRRFTERAFQDALDHFDISSAHAKYAQLYASLVSK